MAENDEVKVYLIVRGFDESPSRITETLGISGTKAWFKGEKRTSRSLLKQKDNGWSLLVDIPSDKNIQEHFFRLSALISNKIDSFEKLPKNSKIILYCVVKSADGRPNISVEPELIKLLSEIHASLEFDLY